jgi:hypothetical protein
MVQQRGQRICVTLGCYDDVLVIREFEPAKPGAAQLKYYARGVGGIKTGYTGNDPEKEVLDLVKIVQLSPDELARLRDEAFALEARANVLGHMPPTERRS